MTTIVNTPPSNESNGFGMIIGVMGIVLLIAFFFYWGLPAIRSMGTPQITVPVEVKMPDKVDVNVTQP